MNVSSGFTALRTRSMRGGTIVLEAAGGGHTHDLGILTVAQANALLDGVAVGMRLNWRFQ